MPRFIRFLTVALILAGCAPTGHLERALTVPPVISRLSVSPDPAFKTGIDTLLADSLFPPSNIGIKIVSTATGEVRYALNQDMLFNPASNQKLVTSATALRTLGPTFPLRTSVFADPAHRTICIKGRGDPLLSHDDMDSLARAAAPLLPQGDPWRLAVNVSYFDDLSWGAGWAWDEEPAAYGMFISPLILDNNTIAVRVQPGVRAGEPPSVICTPATRYVSVENTAVTVADTPLTAPLEVSRKWRERSNTLTVSGQIWVSGRWHTENLSVWKPELYAGAVFAERLGALGVPVVVAAIDTTEPTGKPIAEYTHLLDTALTFMNKVSDNLSAEALLKVVAAETYHVPGSADLGTGVARKLLAGWSCDTTKIAIADGSGLSRYDLTSASTMVQLLQNMARDSANFPVFYHSLPIAGVDGTIGGRMKATPAEGNLRAKTGSLSGVSALSGYVRTAGGEMLTFSILLQNFPGTVRPYRLVQDGIGAFLAGWK
jgi:D-alanyl-D-alanine carboxypeptidase/D-alanyl-D-alanine-endopeptidase (penicillin-binding protein 4)